MNQMDCDEAYHRHGGLFRHVSRFGVFSCFYHGYSLAGLDGRCLVDTVAPSSLPRSLHPTLYRVRIGTYSVRCVYDASQGSKQVRKQVKTRFKKEIEGSKTDTSMPGHKMNMAGHILCTVTFQEHVHTYLVRCDPSRLSLVFCNAEMQVWDSILCPDSLQLLYSVI